MAFARLRLAARAASRRLRLAPRAHRWAHAHHRVVVARDAAAHEEQALLGVDAHHLDVQRGDALVAHVTRHAQALDHAARERAGADRPAVAEVLVRAVGRAHAEAVPLHHAREALALRGADHVDALARAEDVDGDLLADLVLLELLGADPALAQRLRRRDRGLRAVPLERLGGVARCALAVAELEGAVAVAVRGLLLHDAVRLGVQHGHGDALPFVVEQLGHADLAAHELDRHGMPRRAGGWGPERGKGGHYRSRSRGCRGGPRGFQGISRTSRPVVDTRTS